MKTAEAELDNYAPEIRPGEILRRARETRGLKLQEVAASLHLHPSVIEALEADDSSRLPSPIYVRGYLRSYAKLVGADAEQLIAAYDRRGIEPPQIVPAVKQPQQVKSSDRPVRVVTYLLSLCLVLLVFAWWQSKNVGHDLILLEREPVMEQRDDEHRETEVLPPGLSYPIRIVKHPKSLFYPPRSATVAAPADAPLAIAAEEALPEAGNAAGEATAVETPPAPGYGLLLLELSVESWIEVQDADGNKLYYGQAQSGARLNFDGKLPLRVVLGRAHGVTVTFNGERFDTAPYTSTSGVARFKLGG
jgi:cytoskeleton protein RodZ